MSNDGLPTASEAQLAVSKAINHGNVVVDSVAGSGKTTTVLHVARAYPSKNILLLTYNKKLKMETRDRVNRLDITNMEVHSYHSFCVKYYDHKAFTDYELQDIIKNNLPVLKQFSYDIVILDEAQDMSPLYFEVVCKMIKNSNDYNEENLVPTSTEVLPKICVLGDRYQSIFDFNKADNRFIILAEDIFTFNKHEWSYISLDTSFRLTNEMVNFINQCVFKNNRLKAVKGGNKVRYIICNTYENKKFKNFRPYSEIEYYLKKGYKYEDIFVIAPSVRSMLSPVRQLSNKLVENQIPVYVPNTDEEKLDEDILKNKLVFSTYHQVKGLERKVVLVYGMDDSYFKYYKKHANPAVCPNEIYVALTRAKEHLTIFHSNNADYIDFLDVSKLSNTVDLIKDTELYKAKTSYSRNTQVAVTDLTRHLPVNVVSTAYDFIDIVDYNPKKKVKKTDIINIPVKTKQGKLSENVSEITGTSIPMFYEYELTGKIDSYDQMINDGYILKHTDDDLDDYMFDDEEYEEEESDIDLTNLDNLTPSKLLIIGNNWCAYKSGYTHKLKQIINYDWLDETKLKLCINRIKAHVKGTCQFEHKLNVKKRKELCDKELIGYVDCVEKVDDNINIWEFKTVKKIERDHFIQLAIYAYMMETIKRQIFNKKMEDLNATGIIPIIDDQVTIYIDDDIVNGVITKVHEDGDVTVKVDNTTFRRSIACIVNSKFMDEERDHLVQRYCINYNYYLYNIITDEKYEIKVNMDNLTQMIEHIIMNKYYKNKKITDIQFLKITKDIKAKYF